MKNHHMLNIKLIWFQSFLCLIFFLQKYKGRSSPDLELTDEDVSLPSICYIESPLQQSCMFVCV